MAIDWFTVGAQVINFLVLVYLLKRFLYGPIIRAMDRREQAIIARLGDAETQVRATTREKELYTARRQELEDEREALMEEAREHSKEERAHARLPPCVRKSRASGSSGKPSCNANSKLR